MIINSSNVNMTLDRSYKRKELSFQSYLNTTEETGISMTAGDFEKLIDRYGKEKASEEKKSDEAKTEDGSDEQSLSDLSEMLSSAKTNLRDNLYRSQIEQINKVRRELLAYLMRILFHQETYWDESDDMTCEENVEIPKQLGIATHSYITHFEMQEDESVSFSTTGTVVTADGRNIDFNLNLNMSRSFREVTNTRIDYSQPVLIDPLVINMDSSFVGMSDQTFYFDINSDGEAEEIHQLESGSGFLALDENENGVIDDGSELFGTKTGNGFAELGQYDNDKNGWIDEADPIFSKLKVWCKESDGTDTLIDLKTAGVGAIYLGSADGDFSLTDETNQTKAVVRKHGIFLYENGATGSMAQMDLAVANTYSA